MKEYITIIMHDDDTEYAKKRIDYSDLKGADNESGIIEQDVFFEYINRALSKVVFNNTMMKKLTGEMYKNKMHVEIYDGDCKEPYMHCIIDINNIL